MRFTFLFALLLISLQNIALASNYGIACTTASSTLTRLEIIAITESDAKIQIISPEMNIEDWIEVEAKWQNSPVRDELILKGKYLEQNIDLNIYIPRDAIQRSNNFSGAIVILTDEASTRYDLNCKNF